MTPRSDPDFFWATPLIIYAFCHPVRRRVFRSHGRAHNLPWGRLRAQPYRCTPLSDQIKAAKAQILSLSPQKIPDIIAVSIKKREPA
jgi:hypothetical protein